MAMTTFTSNHWAEPYGSKPKKKVCFRPIDEAKWTPEFENMGNILDESKKYKKVQKLEGKREAERNDNQKD